VNKAGVPSSVCTKFGFSASFKSAAIAPCAFISRLLPDCLQVIAYNNFAHLFFNRQYHLKDKKPP
jgi:hypothetical protein